MSMQNREIKLLWRIRAATIVGLLALPIGASAERAYVSNEDGDTVTVIDTAKGEVAATIDVGKRPRGLKVSKDGSLLYVAVSGLPKCPPSVPDEECAKLKRDLEADGIAVIDTTSLKLRELVKAGSDPERFDLSADGHLLFVTNEDAAQTSVLDARTGAIKTQISVGQEPEGVAVSPDGKWVLVTNESANAVSVIDAHSLKLLHAVPVGKRPRDVAFTPDSRTVYVTGEFDASLYRFAVPGGKPVERWVEFRKEARPMAVLMDAPRERLYVSTGRGGTVAVVSLAGKLVTEVSVGARPWGIAVSRDNRQLYTANGPSNDVSVVDLETLKVVRRIPVGKSPWGVAMGPTPAVRKP